MEIRPSISGTSKKGATCVFLVVMSLLQLAGSIVVPSAVVTSRSGGTVRLCPCAPPEKPVPCCCGTSCCSTETVNFTSSNEAAAPTPSRFELVPAVAARGCRGGDEGVSASGSSGTLWIQIFPVPTLSSQPSFYSVFVMAAPQSRNDVPTPPPPRG